MGRSPKIHDCKAQNRRVGGYFPFGRNATILLSSVVR